MHPDCVDRLQDQVGTQEPPEIPPMTEAEILDLQETSAFAEYMTALETFRVQAGIPEMRDCLFQLHEAANAARQKWQDAWTEKESHRERELVKRVGW